MSKPRINASLRDAVTLAVHLRATKPKVPEDVWKLILLPYLEPWRHYHNASHIYRMIKVKDEIGIPFESPEDDTALEWMILGHDWYYKVGGVRGLNEKVSAKATQTLMEKTGMSPWLCRVVPLGIRSTINHQIPKNTSARNRLVIGTLLDLDLMGLGQSPERFAEDTHKIWLEYMPIITRDVFDAGRATWAHAFLKRDHIYHTPAFRHLEDRARKNLTHLVYSS